MGRFGIGPATRGVLCASAVATLVVLALTGCTTTTVADPGTPSVKDLVVSPTGLTGLTIGKQVTASELVSFGQHACASGGGWVPRFAQDENNSSGQPLNPFDIETDGASRTGAITSIFVWSRSIRTATGIHVGSSLAQVRAAYPAATTEKEYSTVLYVVAGKVGQLVIEVAGHNDDAAGEWPAKLLDTVVWMDVIPAGEKPTSIAGNNDAGPCPDTSPVPDLDDGD